MDEIAGNTRESLKLHFMTLWDARKLDQNIISGKPTQVFLDARGKEFFRHEGFYPKAEPCNNCSISYLATATRDEINIMEIIGNAVSSFFNRLFMLANLYYPQASTRLSRNSPAFYFY